VFTGFRPVFVFKNFMKFIIGKKIEMTQVWTNDKVAAVTKVSVGPCVVTQVKNNGSDGYNAVQLGFGEKKEKNINKPQKGHLKNLSNFRYLREFRVEDTDLKRGDEIDLASFVNGDKVVVSSISKGKGFQGVVKRHGFKGTKKTHGNKDQLRMPGSIGATGPAHVFKGTRMGGRMGGDQVTIKNQELVEVDKENNIILIKGSIPGARNSLVLISGEGDLKLIEKFENAVRRRPEGEIKPSDLKVSEDKKEIADTPEKVEKEVVKAKEKVDDKVSSKK
jgi:large subunit ribosomal protein L3